MELAKITSNGQITIPKDIRKKLGVRDGDKVIFLEENGRIIIENAAMIALKTAQEAFAGEAEWLGIKPSGRGYPLPMSGFLRDLEDERYRS